MGGHHQGAVSASPSSSSASEDEHDQALAAPGPPQEKLPPGRKSLRDLKARCTELGLPTTGKRTDIESRVNEAEANIAEQSVAEQSVAEQSVAELLAQLGLSGYETELADLGI